MLRIVEEMEIPGGRPTERPRTWRGTVQNDKDVLETDEGLEEDQPQAW